MTQDHTIIGPPAVPRPSWRALRARPDAAGIARRLAANSVFGYPYAIDEVELVASELVTNALNAACSLRAWSDEERPLLLKTTVTPRWAHLAVTDPDYRPMPASDEGGILSERGRGLTIVDQLVTDRWVHYFERGKTVHVAIAATGITLTAAELAALRSAW